MQKLITYFKQEILLPTANKDNIKELRIFGLTFAVAIPLAFAVLLPWLFSQPVPWWPFILSALLFAGALIYSPSLYYPYRGWMFVGSILAWTNTKIILMLAYYILLVPLGCVLRLFKKLDYIKQPQGNSLWLSPNDSGSSRQQKLKEPF